VVLLLMGFGLLLDQFVNDPHSEACADAFAGVKKSSAKRRRTS
jgi:hypothetical protein